MHLPSYMAECRQRLEDNLTTVARKAREKTLPDVTLADGDLRIAPLRKNTPESAEAFAEKAYALMPHVKITGLLAEVDQWTSLGDSILCIFAPRHRLRTGRPYSPRYWPMASTSGSLGWEHINSKRRLPLGHLADPRARSIPAASDPCT